MAAVRGRPAAGLLVLLVAVAGCGWFDAPPPVSAYGLAYSSGRHFAVTGPWVRLVYASGKEFDEAKLWELVSWDGIHWWRHRIATPKNLHVVSSVWVDQGRRLIAATAYRGTRLFIAGGVWPRAIRKFHDPFSAQAPNGSPEGIVFRSVLTGDRMRLWVRWPDGRIERVTTDAEEAETAAGTSGQLHRVAGRSVVLWSAARALRASWRTAAGWVSEVVDPEFSGVHDVSAVVVDDALWVAYLAGPGMLTVRHWTAREGWSDPHALGPSELHATCLWPDGRHLYAIQVAQNPRRLRVWRFDHEWQAMAQEVPVAPGSYLWACGTSFRRRQVLAWVENAGDHPVMRTAVVWGT